MKPILFSELMVNCILDGLKTQTRRKAKPFNPPEFCAEVVHQGAPGEFIGWCPNPNIDPEFTRKNYPVGTGIISPYGKPGDQVWVRETFYAYGRWEWRTTQKRGKDHDGWHFIDNTSEFGPYRYLDSPPEIIQHGRGGNGWYKRPSIHMPRAASRITLQIESVGVERLHCISEKDAINEGASDVLTREDLMLFSELDPIIPRPFAPYQFGFMKIWCLINGVKEWNSNPWVWVIEFKNC